MFPESKRTLALPALPALPVLPAMPILLLPLLVLGCQDSFTGPQPCGGGPSCWDLGDIDLGDRITVEPAGPLAVGDTLQFVATYEDLDTDEVSEGPFTWASTDTAVLTVQDGLAVARLPGHARVDLVHEPTGKPHSFTQTVALGDAPHDTLALIQVAAGCGVSTDGAAHCWGNNLRGALGLGLFDGVRASANPVVGGHTFVSVHVSTGWQACGLRPDGAALCWGNNEGGGLGTPALGTTLYPSEVAGGLRFRSLYMGTGEICGIAADHAAWCWGATVGGFRTEPTRVESDVVWAALAPGDGRHACGLDVEGTAWCWGANAAGQLGDGTLTDRAAPAPVAGGRTFIDIATVDLGRTCAIEDGGGLFCWGPSISGEDAAAVPEPFGPARAYARLSAGGWQMCALDAQGAAYCWGDVFGGPASAPTPVPGGVAFTSIAVGGPAVCGLATDGRARCWGSNQHGELGDGSFESSAAPRPVVRVPRGG